MSEYWKSTPRYWCQHCKAFIRDTAYERNQHEATGKHQASLKRFLRDIHRDKEKKEREDQRAKNEVERLKGLVSRAETPGKDKEPPWKQQRSGTGSEKAPTASRGAAAEERKKQMAQLADMGVAIPDQYRPEMALMGEWKEAKEDEPLKESTDTVSASAIGVRKRKHRPDDRENNESGTTTAWGSAIRSHPGEDDQELDALLAMTSDFKGKKDVKTEDVKTEVKVENGDAVVKMEEDQVAVKEEEEPGPDLGTVHAENDSSQVKQETGDDEVKREQEDTETTADAPGEVPAVVFKKRKTKQAKR